MNTQRPDHRLVLVVAGMHRSGTSALTRCLHLLGAALPTNLIPAQADNPTGFWESADVQALNDQILAALDTRWDDAQPIHWQRLGTQQCDALVERIGVLLYAQFQTPGVLALKDPRLCRLLPLWKQAFERCGIDARYVLPYRDPREVAASLHRRNHLAQNHGQQLWLRYLLDSERATRNEPRVVVRYDDLLETPIRTLQRIWHTLRPGSAPDWKAAEPHILEHLQQRLRHERVTAPLERSDASRAVRLAWAGITRLSERPDDAHAPQLLAQAASAADRYRASDGQAPDKRVLLQAPWRSFTSDRLPDDGHLDLEAAVAQRAAEHLTESASPAFSIVMPTWNRRNTLGTAIDSVLTQSIPSWELIVCDDGSSDGTVEYLHERYGDWIASGKLRVLRCAHQGVGAARNAALHEARGSWIAYLDSDNRWHKDYLLMLADTFARHPHKRTAFACIRVHEAGVEPCYVRGRPFDWERLKRGNFIDINVFAHHRDVWLQQGGFDASLPRLEDWELILRYTRLYPPVFIPHILCDYFLSPELGNLSLCESVEGPFASVHARFACASGRVLENGIALANEGGLDPAAIQWDPATLVATGIDDATLEQCTDVRPILRCSDEAQLSETVSAFTQEMADTLQAATAFQTTTRRWAQRALGHYRQRLRRSIARERKQHQALHTAVEKARRMEREVSSLKAQLTVANTRIDTLEPQLDWARKAGADHLYRLAKTLGHGQPWRALCSEYPSRADRATGFGGLALAARRALGAPLHPRAYRQTKQSCHALLRSGLFDTAWYLWRYPDVGAFAYHPVWHWLLTGWREGRHPNALFDPRWYLANHPDVAESGANPLLHYLRHGASEARATSPLFDRYWYMAQYPDVRDADVDPLQHYLLHGAAEGRNPHPLVDRNWYLKAYPEVATVPMDPLSHFLIAGGAEGRDPGPDFDSTWYLTQYPDVRAAGMNPLVHFLYHGRDNGRHPSAHARGQDTPRQHEPSKAVETAHRPAAPELKTTAGKVEVNADQATVLLCAHSAGTHLFGGERSFLELLRLLEGMPYNVVVTLPRSTAAYREAVRTRCCEVIELPYQFWSADMEPDRDVIAQLQTIILTRRIDVVHVNTIMIREPLIAASRLGIPSFVHVRESVSNDRWLQERIALSAEDIIREVRSSATGIIANSNESAAEFGNGTSTFLVPNTFDLAALDLPAASSDGGITVGLISSNLPKKGIEDFVRIAEHCAQISPSTRFRLIGPDNDYVQDLRERQANGLLPKTLEFGGYAEQPQDAIAQIDIVMNLSHFAESFGRTVAEALAARRPAIVYDLGAPKHLVQDGETGFVIPHGDWHKAAEQLLQLVQDPQRIRAMGERGRTFIEQYFDASVGRAALEKAYHAFQPDTPAALRTRPLTLRARHGYGEQAQLPDRQRIAYFCWHFPVPSETFVLNELRELIRCGHDVRVFCRHSPHPEFRPDFAIEWQCVDSPEALADALKRTQRQHVHAHFTYPTVTDMVWPACEQAGLPFTFIAHAQDIFRHENDARNRVAEVVASPLCRAVFTLGRFHRDYLRDRGVPASKIIINPNAVDVSRFPFLPPGKRPPRSGKSVCAIHRLTEKKGLHHLLTAAQELAEDDIAIHIYGYGEQEAALKARIDDEALTNVHFHGALHSSAEIVDTLHAHDLFAAPCIRTANGDMDGIPTSVIEAMAAGTPVITTAIASVPDVVQDGITGMLVASDDATALAAGIRRFFALSPAQVDGMSHSARQVATTRHDAAKLTHVLKRVWQQRGIDIVIVSWNNLPELREVVGRLLDFTRTPFHLTIADNGSDAQVIGYLSHLQARHDNVTVVFNDANHFVGPGTNIAAAQGSSDCIVYVCGKEGFTLQEGWETELTFYMEQHPDVGLAGTPGYSPAYLFGADLAQGIPTFNAFRNPDFAQAHPERAFFHIQGGLFVVRRQMLDTIGGFSEAVPHAHTDVEYSYYVESRGWKLGVPPHMLALFSKTRPDMWTRIDDAVRICHPPRLQDLPLLDRIANRESQRCPQCGWQGPQFHANSALAPCPGCGATDHDRFQLRLLAGSALSHRHIDIATVGVPDRLAPFWEAHFGRAQASPLTTTADILALPAQSQDALYLCLTALDSDSADTLLAACAHALKPQRSVAIVAGIGFDPRDWLSDAVRLQRHALVADEALVPGSWTAGHAAYPIVVLQHQDDPSEMRWPLTALASTPRGITSTPTTSIDAAN